MADILSMSSRGEEGMDNQYAMIARLENVKILAQLLKSIHFRYGAFIEATGYTLVRES